MTTKRTRQVGALTVTGISVWVGPRQILRDVNVSVEPGECVGVVGETGAGKTMLCRAISGRLIRIGGRAPEGSVTFDGIDLLRLSAPQWRDLYGRRIGLVPQNSLSSLDPIMRVGKQLKETLRELEPTADFAVRSRQLLEMVHLPRPEDVLRSYPHELSGGMRQRLMIALSLAGRPELLVADEPTSALDMTVQHGIVDLLAELRLLTGMSTIFVTHDLSIVASIADRIAVMYAGTVVEVGTVERIMAQPRHPYTKALLAARPSAERRGEPLGAIPGQPQPLIVERAGCQFAPRCPLASDICRTDVPLLVDDGAGHQVACWHASTVATT
jgi:oligopeptide/dipeptide ABC transporter ATP-binding protein